MKRAKSALLILLLIYVCFSFSTRTAKADPAPPPTDWHAHAFIINCSDTSFSAGVEVAQNLYNVLNSVNGSVIGDSTNNLTVHIHIHWINSTSQLASTFATLSNDTTSLMASEGSGPIIFLNAHGSNLPIPEPGNLFVDSFLFNDPADTYVSVAYSTPKPTWWSYLNSWGQQVRDHGWVFVNVIGYPFRSLSNTPYDYNSAQQQRWGIWTGSGTQQGSGPYPLDEMGLKAFLGPAGITVPNDYNSYIGGYSGSLTGTGSSIASKWHQTLPSTMGVSYPLEILPSISPSFSIYSYGGNPYVAGLEIGGGMYVHAGFTETGTLNYTAIGQVATVAGLEAGWRLSVNSDNQPLGSLAVNVYNNTALTQKVADQAVITISNATSGQLILNQTTWCPQFSYYLSPGNYTVEVTRYFVTYNSQQHQVDVTRCNGTTPTNVTISAGGTTTLNAVVPIAPGIPLALPRGTYVFVIQCQDAPSWWVGDIDKVIEGFNAVMATAGTMFNLIYVNTTQQLYDFMSGNDVTADDGSTLRLGFEYRLKYSVFMNGHGEAIPIPSQFVSGTNPDWRAYFDFIRNKIKQYGWTWLSITGYPFYYVSNHAYDAYWETWNVPGLYNIGPPGVNEFLDTNTGYLYWGSYDVISTVSQISYDFWVASKAFHITGIEPLVLGYRPFPEDPPSRYSYALTQYEDLVGGQKAAVTLEMGSSPREGHFVHFGISRHMNDTMKGKLAALTALWIWFKLGLTWITVVPSDPPASGISIFVWLWNGTWIELLDNITLPAGYINYTFYFVPPYKATLRYTAMVYYNNVYVGSNNIALSRGRMATLYVDTWKAKSAVSVPEFDVSLFFIFLLIGALAYLFMGKRLRLSKRKRGVSTVVMTILMLVIVVVAAIAFYIWYTGWLGKYTADAFRDTGSESISTEEIQLFSPVTVTTSGAQTILAMHYLNLGPEEIFIDSVYVDGNRIFHANSSGQPPTLNFYVLSSNPVHPNLNTIFRLTPIPNTLAPQLYIVLNYYQPLRNIIVRVVTSDGQSATFAEYVP